MSQRSLRGGLVLWYQVVQIKVSEAPVSEQKSLITSVLKQSHLNWLARLLEWSGRKEQMLRSSSLLASSAITSPVQRTKRWGSLARYLWMVPCIPGVLLPGTSYLIVTAVLVRHSSLRKGGSAKTRSNCSRRLRSTFETAVCRDSQLKKLQKKWFLCDQLLPPRAPCNQKSGNRSQRQQIYCRTQTPLPSDLVCSAS